MAEEEVETDKGVTPLELFFDLVFVFAFTQVTGFMSKEPTWSGVGKGMLILAAVWWAWAAYAWLTNALDPDRARVRIAIFTSMAAMLVAALAVPKAFGDDGVLFGVAYFVVRILHMGVWLVDSRGDADLSGALKRMGPWVTIAPALLIVAGFLDGPAQYGLWIAALALDYLGPVIGGPAGFTVSPRHFAERFGLIFIIAVGESIVAVGVGVEGIDLGAGEILAAVFGIAIAACLWWAYFDVVAPVAERKLTEAQGTERIRLARDSYAYLHLPMIAGVVLLALGAKKTLGHVDEPLKLVTAFALSGGVALYLLAHIAFRARNVHSLNVQRLVTAVALLAFIPLAGQVDAVVAIGIVAAACVTLITYETIRFREARERIRTAHA
jgi:low temperature requirement protein LtrA